MTRPAGQGRILWMGGSAGPANGVAEAARDGEECRMRRRAGSVVHSHAVADGAARVAYRNVTVDTVAVDPPGPGGLVADRRRV